MEIDDRDHIEIEVAGKIEPMIVDIPSRKEDAIFRTTTRRNGKPVSYKKLLGKNIIIYYLELII